MKTNLNTTNEITNSFQLFLDKRKKKCYIVNPIEKAYKKKSIQKHLGNNVDIYV